MGLTPPTPVWTMFKKTALFSHVGFPKNVSEVFVEEVEEENEIGEMGSEEESEDFETLLIEW